MTRFKEFTKKDGEKTTVNADNVTHVDPVGATKSAHIYFTSGFSVHVTESYRDVIHALKTADPLSPVESRRD